MALSLPNPMLRKKPITGMGHEGALKRTLGPINLTLIGIGCIVGAGIYVMTGAAAASYAGPAIIISFIIAGCACSCAALCYAELASMMPVAGASYAYAYASLGEVFAWIMACLLVLEYGVAAATVAAGWSGYLVSLLHDFGVSVPAVFSNPTVQAVADAEGRLAFGFGESANLLAGAGVLAVAALLIVGVSESAAVNNIIVFIKVAVLLAFVIVGAFYVDRANWSPFIPAHEGGFAYGWPGIVRGASVVFFAYIGFEAVSTAAAEARNPSRDVPIGILTSLGICTFLYMAVAAVLTGVVSFRALGVPDPLAVAVDAMQQPAFGKFVKIGAFGGLSSVMLVLLYGQSRILYAVSSDGLLPRLFSAIHPRWRTPWLGTIVIGAAVAVAATVLPITILGDLVSLGTAIAFMVVCFTVMYLRRRRPDVARPFRVPLGGLQLKSVWVGWIPLAGMILGASMAAPLLADIIGKALRGDVMPAAILGTYCCLGAFVYVAYGFRHSKLATSEAGR